MTPEEGGHAVDSTASRNCDQEVDLNSEECGQAADSETPAGCSQVANPKSRWKPGRKAPGKAKAKNRKEREPGTKNSEP